MAVVGAEKHVTSGTTASSTKCKASSQLVGGSTQGEVVKLGQQEPKRLSVELFSRGGYPSLWGKGFIRH